MYLFISKFPTGFFKESFILILSFGDTSENS